MRNDGCLKFLHITDLHIGRSEVVQSRWAEEFFKHASRQAEWPPGLVIVSGDLVEKASWDAAAISSLTEFLSDLRKKLPSDTKFVFTPGNHDISKAANNAPFSSQWHEKDRDDFFSGARKDLELIFEAAHADYRAFLARLNFPAPSALGHGIFPGDAAYALDCHGKSVGLITLNTAFLTSLGHLRGSLDIHPKQLEKICGNFYKWCSQMEFVVLVTHHPLSALAEPSRIKILEVIKDYVHLHLYGDQHANDEHHELGYRGNARYRGRQSASLFAAHGEAAARGYTVGMIDTTGGIFRCRSFEIATDSERFTIARRDPDENEPIAYRDAHMHTDLDQTDFSNFSQWLLFVPKRIFPPQHGAARTSKIAKHFERTLASSTTYKYLGDSARFTTVQIHDWIKRAGLSSQVPGIERMKFLLALPTESSLASWMSSLGEEVTDATVERRILDIATTLYGLQEIEKSVRTAWMTEIDVHFLSYPTTYRLELFDKGLYLTYHELGGRFGTTLYYSKEANGRGLSAEGRGVYDALADSFKRQFATELGTHWKPGQDICDLVGRLGAAKVKLNDQVLAEQWHERLVRYE